ncbi:hypothetical protein AB0284_22515 [Pseudarthrobacter phenanthrenivorans]|uniref:hypothetical protein n=1 Tax=Micrococcaceae TaxID=1268 RepID=UPI002786685B|nr:hypothetical protein [Sinomonas atrocyanea]MDP9886021.1 hypothetical protein [Sinomonas atrocyanea]
MSENQDQDPIVVQEADAIYESVRTICHHSETQPAPTVYRVLGNLKGAAGPMLAQALNQLADGLVRSLDEYEVYQDDGSDPVLNIAAAAGHMRLAAQLAADLGEQLSEAQNAIAQQGYRD